MIFNRFPFDIKENAHAVLIARYLIEDNTDDYVFYDENAKNDVNFVKSVLRQLLGTIRVLNPEEEQTIFNEISEVFWLSTKLLRILTSLY